MDNNFREARDEMVKNFIININKYFDLIKKNEIDTESLEMCKDRYNEVNSSYPTIYQNLKKFDDEYVSLLTQLFKKQKKDRDDNKSVNNLIRMEWYEPVTKKINEALEISKDKNFLKQLKIKFQDKDSRDLINEDDVNIEKVALTSNSEFIILPEIKCMKLCNETFKCNLGDCKIIDDSYTKCIDIEENKQKNKTLQKVFISLSVCCSSLIILIIIIVVIMKSRKN